MNGSCIVGSDELQLAEAASAAAGPTAFVNVGYCDSDFGPKQAQVVIKRSLLPEIPNLRLANQAIGQQLRTVLMSRLDLGSVLLSAALTNNLPEGAANSRLLRGLEVGINLGFMNLEGKIEDLELREQVQGTYFESLTMYRGSACAAGGAPISGESQLEAGVALVQRVAAGEASDIVARGREWAASMKQINLWSRQEVEYGVILRHWHGDECMEMFSDPNTGQEQLINCLFDPRDQSITVIFRRKIEGVQCATAARRCFPGSANACVQSKGGEIRTRVTGREFNIHDLGDLGVSMRQIAADDSRRQR